MTCTVTLNLPGLSFVAADTRLNIRDVAGIWSRIDGAIPTKLQLRSGRQLEIPMEMRKIRLIAGSWLASTGDFVTTQVAFEYLAQATEQANEPLGSVWARVREQVHQDASAETNFSIADSDRTLILQADPACADGVTALHLAAGDVSQEVVGQFAITWPPNIDPSATTAASALFSDAVTNSLPSFNIGSALRAALEVLSMASDLSKTVGPLAQIGIATQVAGNGIDYWYCAGETASLLLLSDAELKAALRSAA